MELDAIVSGAKGRGEWLSEATKIISSDQCWSSATQTKRFDGAWDRVKVDQKERQSCTGEEFRTNDGTVNSTPHTSHFLVDSQHFLCDIDIGSRTRCVARISYMCHLHVVCCLILYDSPVYSLLSIFSLIFLFILLIIFIFHVGGKNLAHSCE